MSLANWSDIIDICKDCFPRQQVIKEEKIHRNFIIKRNKISRENQKNK